MTTRQRHCKARIPRHRHRHPCDDIGVSGESASILARMSVSASWNADIINLVSLDPAAPPPRQRSVSRPRRGRKVSTCVCRLGDARFSLSPKSILLQQYASEDYTTCRRRRRCRDAVKNKRLVIAAAPTTHAIPSSIL